MKTRGQVAYEAYLADLNCPDTAVGWAQLPLLHRRRWEVASESVGDGDMSNITAEDMLAELDPATRRRLRSKALRRQALRLLQKAPESVDASHLSETVVGATVGALVGAAIPLLLRSLGTLEASEVPSDTR